MENGHFLVYDTQGNFLGLVDLRFGNEVMTVHQGKRTKPLVAYLKVHPRCVLHLDNQSTSQAWAVKVGLPYRERSYEFWVTRLPDRATQYPRTKERYWWTPIWEFIQTVWP